MIEITGRLQADATTADGESLSLQKQLVGRLQQAILSGRLPAGSSLPSSRALAEELGVSRNTVVNAYDHLSAEGYVLADRQGTRVTFLSSQPGNRECRQHIGQPITLAGRLDRFAKNHPQPATEALLLPGVPALDSFPLAAWRRSLERVMALALPDTLGYGRAAGEPELRDAIAAHLHMARGVHCDGSQVVVTEGAHEALSLCVTLLTNPGDTAWVEDPGYRGAKAAFLAGDLRTVPVRVDKEGLAVTPDEWQTRPPKLVYTTPAHQYPTGAVLSVARRLELIAEATRAGAWLIEDDYDGEFRHTGEPISSMQGLVADAPVLYVGSFSKTMFPSLRIGFVVFPRGVMRQAQAALNELLRGGHRLEQLALADFIRRGEFARHLGRMRRLYRERQNVLRTALNEHFHGAEILGGKSGMHLTLRLSPEIQDRAVVKRAQRHGVGARALSTFTIESAACQNGLVLGYGNTRSEEIAAAVGVLGRVAGEVRPGVAGYETP